MKTVLVLCAATLATPAAPVLAQISTTAMASVFQISPDAHHTVTATTFLAQINGKPELVTARHVLESLSFPTKTTVYINTDGGWKPFTVTVTYSLVYDLAVLHTEQLGPNAIGMPICGEDEPLGFDTNLYFLGFPFGLSVDAVSGPLTPRLPFAKRAGLAGSMYLGLTSHPMLVLDAMNNYGFSGGPVIKHVQSIRTFQACVMGVTSAFYPGVEPVKTGGRSTGAGVEYNSGLMYAVPRSGILDVSFAKP